MSRGKRRSRRAGRRLGYYALGGAAVAVLLVVAGVLVLRPVGEGASTTTQAKPIILYVNQGNGVVNASNFGSMLSFARSQGFNTVFFQVYREGVLLFQPSDLTSFVQQAHAQGLAIYFALYFTNSSQQLPSSVYPLGEDGINLDMSTLALPAQSGLLTAVQQAYHAGKVSITTTDLTLPLKPDVLVLETYGTGYDSYIRPGVVASVGVFTTSSRAQYEQEFQYALQNSDGVMVFDYAGLLKSGY
ncbi:MAG: hypothetical protein ABSF83_12820 [Nitrososphaerales archaeon]|jgi:hypothetical protein